MQGSGAGPVRMWLACVVLVTAVAALGIGWGELVAPRAAAAVQEMLLQSYSGTILVFPAVPDSWKDASFKTLRAEGAFLVSAERKSGLVQRVEILSEKGGPCRLENPFADAGFDARGVEVESEGGELRFSTEPGQHIFLVRR